MNNSSLRNNKDFKYSIKDELIPMALLHTLKNKKKSTGKLKGAK